ncbi:MAG: NFACT RNA binding domain-containing protein [Candidatus Izemoplasmatales bacterium]|jgi:predicted ribosome quality control (RQC) complex YloA/Tae2 family protein|nr:NFACT RNA binding domain-containing protein [Candidatus Izemoplasmatales bacterium]
MSVDGRFIEHLAKELNQETVNARINKVSQLSKADFLFSLSNNKNLYLSLSTALARIHLVNDKFTNTLTPGGFCMFLRKYIEKGIVLAVKSLNHDRIIEIKLNNRNDIGDIKDYYLMVELFGRYANLVILDEDKTIINAFKHIHPFDNVDRIIVNGIKYALPKDDKISPDDLKTIETFFKRPNLGYRDIIDNIRGVSPLLAKKIIKTANYKEEDYFQEYKRLFNEEVKPTKKGSQFYYLDIFDGEREYFSSLSELLEVQFKEASSLDRVRQIHKYLANFVKNHLEKNLNKLEKLNKDLRTAEDNQINRIKGDLIIQHLHEINSKTQELKLYSYELDEEVLVEIDLLLSLVDNANKYYSRYKKQKSAIKYIKEQIHLTKIEIDYFKDLTLQITDNYELKDLEEIQDELINNRYLQKKKAKNNKKNPNYDIFYDEEGVMIVVGKNNIQNNFITHKLSKKDYYWFHVQNQSGSHTVCMTDEPLKEITIRTAANLAALYSKSKMSSSVPVDYTKIKHVKKIPRDFGSHVTYTNQKTIYIDPDLSLKEKLRKG